jgi:hypothetical protein
MMFNELVTIDGHPNSVTEEMYDWVMMHGGVEIKKIDDPMLAPMVDVFWIHDSLVMFLTPELYVLFKLKFGVDV